MFTITIKIKESEIKKYGDNLMKKIDLGLNDLTDFIATKSDAILRGEELGGAQRPKHPGSFDTGMLAKSLVVNKEKEFEKIIAYEAPHACIVGSHQKVRLDEGYKEIGRVINNNKILTKDGKFHKINMKISDLRVIDKPNLIILKSKKSRIKDGLIVTDDHLILTYKNNYIYWEMARNLNIGDIVFHLRKNNPFKGTAKKVKRICYYCHEEFNIHPSELNHRKANYCSQKCYHSDINHNYAQGKRWELTLEQRQRRCGKNNPSWSGGNSKLPYGMDWTEVLKESIKERDNYICQECKKEEDWYDYSFHVHHIDGNKFNNNPINLITLCPSCHGKQQWKDAELVTIDLNIFEPVELIKAEKIHAKEYFKDTIYKGALKKTKLYDLNIDEENSFIANGILIHNSYIEFGTAAHWTPIKPIYEWVMRQRSVLGVNPHTKIEAKSPRMKAIMPTYYKEAMAPTMGIINKIHEEGSEAKPFLRPAVSRGKIEANAIIKRQIEKLEV